MGPLEQRVTQCTRPGFSRVPQEKRGTISTERGDRSRQTKKVGKGVA